MHSPDPSCVPTLIRTTQTNLSPQTRPISMIRPSWYSSFACSTKHYLESSKTYAPTLPAKNIRVCPLIMAAFFQYSRQMNKGVIQSRPLTHCFTLCSYRFWEMFCWYNWSAQLEAQSNWEFLTASDIPEPSLVRQCAKKIVE